MPKIMIVKLFKSLLLILILLCSVNLSAQSKKVWLYQADYNFSLNQYPTALRFYHMVLDDSLGLAMTMIPYEVQLSNQELDKFSSNDTVKTVTLEDILGKDLLDFDADYIVLS